MTKTEANAALCRELGVGPLPITCGCYDMEQACTCEPPYPDLTSADALMAALRSDEHQFRVSDVTAKVWRNGGGFSDVVLSHETHGHMLFRAACAAFGVQYEAGS